MMSKRDELVAFALKFVFARECIKFVKVGGGHMNVT